MEKVSRTRLNGRLSILEVMNQKPYLQYDTTITDKQLTNIILIKREEKLAEDGPHGL
jgi:hypothetical protein